MTQGEDHRSGAPSADFQRPSERSQQRAVHVHPREIAGSVTAPHTVSEVLLPPSHRPSSQQQPAGDDARNLLQFVHHASCDIKAALDKSVTHRRSEADRDFLEKHLKQPPPHHTHQMDGVDGNAMTTTEPAAIRRFSPESMLAHHYKNHHHHQQQHHHHTTQEDAGYDDNANSDRNNSFFTRSTRDIYLQRHDKPIREPVTEHSKYDDHPLKTLDQSCKHSGDDEHDKSRLTLNKREVLDDQCSDSLDKNFDLFTYADAIRDRKPRRVSVDGERDPLAGDSNNGSDSDNAEPDEIVDEHRVNNKTDHGCENKPNPVPLRKRRLPASFWQEPKGKSDNHKTQPNDHELEGQPRSFVHHPGLSLFGQLKLPLPNPLTTGRFDLDFGLRHFGADKNPFLYPSTSSSASPFFNLNLNLPYRHHMPLPLSHAMDERNRHALPMPCGSNMCMCHLQNLAGCSPVCDPSTQTNPGLFGRTSAIPPISPLSAAPSPALALSRWSAMQSSLASGEAAAAAAAADVSNGYPMRRVLKPIPTKSITSYPPRFHPIFT